MAQALAETSDHDAAAVQPKLIARHIFAATVGNALEFYDFVTYAIFAIQIGHAFFPSHDPFTNLMLSLATFGAGFVTRPVGAFIIGAYADRVGRRPAMMLSFTLMGAAIIFMALIPSYAAIGVAAPILAIAARMVQGFSLGGEVGPNTAYLLEASALNRRGLTVSWQGASQLIAVVIASLIGMGLSALLPPALLDAYGWRIAFLFGAVTLPFGLLLRRTMPETLHTPEPTAAQSASGPVSGSASGQTGQTGDIRGNLRIIVLGLMVVGGGTISTYVGTYMTTFAQNTLHMSPLVGFAAVFVPTLISIPAILFGGWLSDRIGRRPVMIWPSVVGLIGTIPLFYWMVMAHSAAVLLGVLTFAAIVSNFGGGAFYAALSETLPKRIRGRGFASIYAVALALFGGTTQLVITWLIKVTGSPMAPAWYLLAANLAALVGMALILETAPARIAPALITEPPP